MNLRGFLMLNYLLFLLFWFEFWVLLQLSVLKSVANSVLLDLLLLVVSVVFFFLLSMVSDLPSATAVAALVSTVVVYGLSMGRNCDIYTYIQ